MLKKQMEDVVHLSAIQDTAGLQAHLMLHLKLCCCNGEQTPVCKN